MAHIVTLIKLGGSIITDKTIPNSVRYPVLRRLLKQIKRAQQVLSLQGEYLVLGHGSGSFAHVPATHYRTAEGFINDQSLLGMAITQDSAAQLNRIVVRECLRQEIPAVSLYASNSVVLQKGQVASYYDEVFRAYLRHGLLPVVTGDVLVDTDQGCGIWSADTILPYFAIKFQQAGWHVKQLIHVTSTPGVFHDIQHPEKGIFAIISRDNKDIVEAALGTTKGFDVTGGMRKKVAETLDLADHGVESVILSGEEPNMLYHCLVGDEFTGTRVVKKIAG